MKKSNKKIPKTHLPKFSPGGKTTTLSNDNEVSMYDAGPSGNDATSNFYNDKRSQGSGLGKTSNYAAAAAGTLGSYASVANNSNLNSAQKITGYTNAANQTADAVLGAVPVYGQLYGALKGVSDMALNAGTKSNIDPNTGEKAYKGKFGSTAAVLATPTHTNQITAWGKLLGGDTSAKNLLSSFTDPTVIGAISAMTTKKDKYGDNQKAIDAKNQEAEAAYNQQQAIYQQQQNDYINNAIQAGMANYQTQPQGTSIKYAQGGMNIQPNAIPQYPNGGKIEPIYVNDKNDPRLRAYNDSLDAYQWNKKALDKVLKTGYSPQGSKIDINNYIKNTHSQQFNEDKEKYKKWGLKLTDKDINDEMDRVDPINKGTGKLNKAIYYYTFPISNSGSKFSLAQYKKPVQPYKYQEQEPVYENQFTDQIKSTFKEVPKQEANQNRSWNFNNPNYKALEYKDNTGKVINTEYYDFNNKPIQKHENGGIQYTGGGNGQINGEVEKEENSIAPDGTFTQFSGKSHEAGGIKTDLQPGELIFSDKLKLGKKTFAQLNKVNNTNKQDKVLDNPNADRISKKTAELLRMAKLKNSEMLFRQQESLKQEKIENYIKRMGGIQKYPLGGTSGQTLNDNSIVQQTYQQDPRFYNYQGNPVMKPNVKALGKDTGVSSDIGINNYNNLLNTRSQVQNSKVNVGKQLPKFEYINDPSKGDYNTQFENYKKVNVGYFRNGGRKGGKYKAPVAEYNPQDDIIVPGVPKSNTDFSNVLAPSPYDKQMDITDANTLNKSAWDADYLNNPNAERPVENPESNKFDWKGLATQGAYFAANNAGNIYDLARADKTETRKYERMTANLLDPTAALRDAEAQTRRAEYNVRGASGGNAGTYLSNRVALNTQNIENKDRIRQQYANANAGILNETSKINTGIANEEILANAKIRANARNIKQSAIASTGSNVANQMNDVRNTEMDQKRVDNLVKMYPSLSKDPEMLKYLMSLMSFK